MKKKIIFFEPDRLLKNTLLEQISLNKDFEITEISNLEGIQHQLKKSSFDLIILGTDREDYSPFSIRKFIKEAVFKNLNIKSKFIKIIAENFKELPSWHEAAGSKCWIFTDEIIVR